MAEATPKIFQTGAYLPENGLFSASPQSLGWGDPLSWKTPGALNAIPWLEYGNQITVNSVTDDSVTTNAAMSTPRITGLRVDLPFNFLARFDKIGSLHYWMFGFENVPQAVFVFEVDPDSSPWGGSEPASGTDFEDGSTTQFTYLRTEPAKNALGEAVNYYLFASSTAPDTVLGSGQLTETGGGGETFDYTTASTQKYEHLYELDSFGRRYREYMVSEQISGYSAGDKKNLMITLAKRMSIYDFRYGNAMCRSFTYNNPTQDMAVWETNFLAYAQERSSAAGGFGSATWTLPENLEDNGSTPSHFQSRTHLGTTVGVIGTDPDLTLTELCSSDFSVSVEIPLKQEGTTCSGLRIAEPILEGKYDITYSDTILYHDDPIYMEHREQNVRLFGRFASYLGHDMIEILMKNIVLSESAGPDDSEVASEPLEGKVSATEIVDDQWASSGWLEGNTQVHNMPLVMRVRNDTAANHMFLF